MRRAASLLLVALVVMLLGEVGARGLAPAMPAISQWREPLVEAKAGQVDAIGAANGAPVVFAGSSQMLFGVDPKKIRQDGGIAWPIYNAGIWGAPPIVNEDWLLRVVTPKLHPKTLFLGVSILDFIESPSTPAIHDYFAAPAVRDDILGSLQRKISGHSALVRERANLRNPKVVFNSARRRLHRQPGPALRRPAIDAFGYLSYAGDAFVGDALARPLVANLVTKPFAAQAKQTKAFTRTVRELKQRGVEVIVMNMAVSRGLIDLFPKGAADYDAYMRFITGEAKALHVAMLDTSEGANDPRLFFDYDHLNAVGSTALNRFLTVELRDAVPGAITATVTQPPAAGNGLPEIVADALRTP